MTSTQIRLAKLVREHLGAERKPDFNADFGDADVSSLVAVAFIREVGREFGVKIPPQDFATIQTLGQLAEYLDSRSA